MPNDLKQDTKKARESLWTLVRKWASDLLKPKAEEPK